MNIVSRFRVRSSKQDEMGNNVVGPPSRRETPLVESTPKKGRKDRRISMVIGDGEGEALNLKFADGDGSSSVNHAGENADSPAKSGKDSPTAVAPKKTDVSKDTESSKMSPQEKE